MASRFVLTAQVQLQAPTNARQVVNQIQQQLRGVNMQVNLQGGQQAARQVNNLNKATKQATTQATKMGKAFGASIRRFGAFTIATRAVSLFTNSLANATKEAIDFEREMIKISQVTGKTMAQLKGLENTITELATSLGVSSKSILSVGRILSQAGIQARDLEVALRTLAKTELAPTFDDITKTAEGAVAILAQFGEGVGALERQLGAINAVAGQFAVESGDLISAVRRTGGVFKAAGGELEELIALFTSVRATTRESAESIATGLRTIFTRIQRPQTIEFLKQFGVELTDLNGKFVGPYQAIQQLSTALSGLGEGDIRFVQIAEELGGFRQIGKVIPLLQQFETAERARQAAIEGGTSLDDDAAKAQKALAVQIAKVKEEFLALIRSVSQTSSFQLFVKTSLELASALIKIADALKPLLPLLATFGAIKFARGAAGFARGIGAGLRGGSPTGFARGGMVPGTGNRDTVPAMLTPGEFVIRKSSVSKLGAGTLAAMNDNKFNKGGKVADIFGKFGYNFVDNLSGTKGSLAKTEIPISALDQLAISKLSSKSKGGTDRFIRKGSGLSQVEARNIESFIKTGQAGVSQQKALVKAGLATSQKAAAALNPKDVRKQLLASNRLVSGFPPGSTITASGGFAAGLLPNASKIFDQEIYQKLPKLFTAAVKKFQPPLGGLQELPLNKLISESAINSIRGQFFEAFVRRATDQELKETKTDPLLDFKTGDAAGFKALFGSSVFPNEFKINNSQPNIASAYTKAIKEGLPVKMFATGGGISGSDTVPAMLTPGEFVFNANAAKSIGYSNLNRMNKHGVKGFNKGGIVGGVQYFNEGTSGSGATSLPSRGGVVPVEIVSSRVPLGGVDTDPRGLKIKEAPGGKLSTPSTVEEFKKSLQNLIKTTNEEIKKKQQETKIIDSAKKAYDGVKKRVSDFGKNVADSARSVRNTLKFENLKRSAADAGKKFMEVGRSSIVGKLRQMAASAAEVIAGDRQKAAASKQAAMADKQEAAASKAASASSGGGGMGMMGIMMAATSIAAFIPQVEGATEGMGAMQNEFGSTIMQLSTFAFLISSLPIPMNKFTMAIGAAVAATFAVTKMMDAYTGVHEKAKKAVEEGNVEAAGAAGVKSKNASLANAAAMGMAGLGAAAGAALGTFFGPIGTAVGAAIGGIVGTIAGVITKIVLSLEAFAPVLNWFRDNILTLFGADSTAMVEARARMDAAAARETKQLADASKAASDAMKGVEDGSMSIQQAFQSGALTKGFKAVQEANKERTRFAQAETKEAVGKAGSAGIGGALLGGAVAGVLNASTFGLGTMAAKKATGSDNIVELGDEIGAYIGLWDSASERTKKALAEASEKEKKAREQNNKLLVAQLKDPTFQKGFDTLARSIANTAATMTGAEVNLESVISAMGEEGEAVRQAMNLDPEVRKQFEDKVKAMAEAARENAEFLKSLNFGIKDVAAGVTAFNSSLDNIATSSQSGYNSLSVATTTLGSVVAGAASAISQSDLDSSLQTLSSSFSAFGATENQINRLTGTIDGFYQAQNNANAALDSLRSNLAGVDLSDKGNLSSVQEDFKQALLKTIPDDSPIKGKLSSAFNNIGDLTKDQIEQFYKTGDASPILEKAFGPIGDQIESQILKPMKDMETANAKLIKATEARRDAELKLIEVQKKAIDIQIDAAKNMEEFGGPKFTPEREFAARREQANLTLGGAGVRGLTTGSAQDIRRASREVFRNFSGQQQAQNIALEASGGTRGAFADRQGVDADKRPQLQEANQALIEITKQGIEQRKKELEIIQKKNQAEKDALDSLLGGNIEEFFEKSSAAAAGAALRTGNAAAASLFSAGSLGRGLQGLQGTGLSDAENKRASQLAFGAFGLGDRAAQIFSGTTAEEERIKAEGRELSQLQSDLGGQMADMQSMDVQAKQVIINTQEAKFQEAQSRVQQNQAALGLRKGGPVYASTGMFIPRGTDTVPAMLTPGEFVVNRAAVQRGNNLQILRAMNGGMGTGATNAAGTPTLNRGGIFGGGRAGAPSFEMPDFSSVFTKFSEAVDKLAGLNISVKLDTTNVNVNFNGSSFLSTLDEKIRSAVLEEVSKETGKLAFNETGDIKATNRSVLG